MELNGGTWPKIANRLQKLSLFQIKLTKKEVEMGQWSNQMGTTWILIFDNEQKGHQQTNKIIKFCQNVSQRQLNIK